MGVSSTREPGSWEEVQWAYQMETGWSAYRKGTVMHLTFYSFSSRRTAGCPALTTTTTATATTAIIMIIIFTHKHTQTSD